MAALSDIVSDKIKIVENNDRMEYHATRIFKIINHDRFKKVKQEHVLVELQ